MKSTLRHGVTGWMGKSLLGLTLVAGTTGYGGGDEPARHGAAQRRPATLHGIKWHSSVADALHAAKSPARGGSDRPVLCLRVLGNLSGDM